MSTCVEILPKPIIGPFLDFSGPGSLDFFSWQGRCFVDIALSPLALVVVTVLKREKLTPYPKRNKGNKSVNRFANVGANFVPMAVMSYTLSVRLAGKLKEILFA